ncbi:MAG: glycerophosphodiester phosphodiesterase [Pseudomonadales bacterium]|nr:glycerophosphodiester phosphodiesterase [Pseudomonadales bacterium]
MKAFLDHTGLLAFAHRGDHQSGPENTLAAFEGAVKKGYRYLETDTHCTRDDVLLAFHDHRLDRVTDASGVISELDFAEIQPARVAGREPIPRLADLITAFPDTRFNIDLKADNTVQPFLALIRQLRCQDRLCVGSFSHERVSAVRTAFPGICTSLTPKEVLWARLRSFHIPTFKIHGDCAQVPERSGRIPLVDRRFVNTARKLGIQTHVWTINEVPDMRRLSNLGVEGLMTDDAGALKQVLQDLGRW